jgi:hypothetical protein
MICFLCKKDFQERDIEESHDVPCYLFWMYSIERRIRKQFADKLGRHLLCKECHKKYEKELNEFLIKEAKEYSKRYFSDGRYIC